MNTIFALTEHYASNYSLILALVDLIPVALFCVAGIILLKGLYKKIAQYSYTLLSAGIIFVGIAGLFKSIWKILCSLSICDFVAFNVMFFPLSCLGFILILISSIDLLKNHKSFKLYTFSPLFLIGLLFLSKAEEPLEMVNITLPFIIIQAFASSIAYLLLGIFSIKKQNKLAFIFFILTFVFIWGMGGIAALDGKMNVILWNWLEEIVNTLTQLFFLLGSLFLYEKTLKNN